MATDARHIQREANTDDLAAAATKRTYERL